MFESTFSIFPSTQFLLKCKRNRDKRNIFSSKIVSKVAFFSPQKCHELAKTFSIIFLLFNSLGFCNSFSLLLWSIMPKNISAKCKQVMGVFTASSFFTPFLLEPNILTTYFGHIHTHSVSIEHTDTQYYCTFPLCMSPRIYVYVRFAFILLYILTTQSFSFLTWFASLHCWMVTVRLHLKTLLQFIKHLTPE